MIRIYVAVSALIGALLCVLADLAQKNEASAILKLGDTLDNALGVPYSVPVSIVLILLLGASLCFIFDISDKKRAFYLGASVLAMMMTLVPYEVPQSFKTSPHSVQIILEIKTADNKPVDGAIITLRPSDSRTILARSRISANQFSFYQDGGSYKLSVEMPGYQSEVVDLNINEGSQPTEINITLRPSEVPLFIQRLRR